MKRRTPWRMILESVEGSFLLLGVALAWPIARYWLRSWGARLSERRRTWPGDAFVLSNGTTTTRAISVQAPAPQVWQWVVQIGLGRAGFYSYEWLERCIGIPVINVESIEPSLQHLKVGDEIRLHPKAPGIPVGLVKENEGLCFGIPNDSGKLPEATARSWSFYLEAKEGRGCRLIVRNCIPPSRTVGERLTEACSGPIDFVMEQRLLRTIRRLAEGS